MSHSWRRSASWQLQKRTKARQYVDYKPSRSCAAKTGILRYDFLSGRQVGVTPIRLPEVPVTSWPISRSVSRRDAKIKMGKLDAGRLVMRLGKLIGR